MHEGVDHSSSLLQECWNGVWRTAGTVETAESARAAGTCHVSAGTLAQEISFLLPQACDMCTHLVWCVFMVDTIIAVVS